MYIIYGKGQILQKNLHKIDLKQVVAIVDKNAEVNEKFEGIDVIQPSEIKNYNYDEIYIFTTKFYNEIKESLVKEYFLASDIIFPFDFLMEEEDIYSNRKSNLILEIVNKFNIKSILDVHSPAIGRYTLFKNNFFKNNNTTLDYVGSIETSFVKNIYDNVFDNLENINQEYDLLNLFNFNFSQNKNTYKILDKFKYCLIEFAFDLDRKEEIDDEIKNVINILENKKYNVIGNFKIEKSIIYFFKKVEEAEKDIDVNIFVVTHKKYKVLQDEMYKPICVGKNYVNEEFYNENTGDNIAYLNEKINECTAIYWIWKNTKSEYIGLNHYRRYFYNNDFMVEENYLDKYTIRELLDTHDIVLAKSYSFNNTLIEQLIESSVNKDDVMFVKKIFEKNIEKFQPEYLSCFEAVIDKSNNFFRCNIFVTKREIFKQYCEWLFSFLIPTAEEVDTTAFEGIDKRMVGFFAERMLTVWLLNQNLEIFELPFSNMYL